MAFKFTANAQATILFKSLGNYKIIATPPRGQWVKVVMRMCRMYMEPEFGYHRASKSVHCLSILKFDGLVKDYSISIDNAMEILWSCTKLSVLCYLHIVSCFSPTCSYENRSLDKLGFITHNVTQYTVLIQSFNLQLSISIENDQHYHVVRQHPGSVTD